MRNLAFAAVTTIAIAGACATSAPSVSPSGQASAPASESAVPSASASPSGSPGATPTLSGVTWKDYSVEKPERFSISLPDTWQAIDPTTLADTEQLEDLKRRNPALASVIEMSIQQMARGSIAFVGLDPRSATPERPFADNANVVPPMTRVRAADFDVFAQQSMAAVQQALKLATPPRARDVTLPGADQAIETSYAYELAITQGGAKVTVAVQQYLILKADKPFVLSLTTTQDQLAARITLFREIANRFRPG